MILFLIQWMLMRASSQLSYLPWGIALGHGRSSSCPEVPGSLECSTNGKIWKKAWKSEQWKFLNQISCKLNCSDEFSHESFCVVCVHRWVFIISWLSKLHIILNMRTTRSAIFHCFREPMVSCKVSPVLLWLALLSAFVPSACTSRSSYLFIAILLGAQFFVYSKGPNDLVILLGPLVLCCKLHQVLWISDLAASAITDSE